MRRIAIWSGQLLRFVLGKWPKYVLGVTDIIGEAGAQGRLELAGLVALGLVLLVLAWVVLVKGLNLLERVLEAIGLIYWGAPVAFLGALVGWIIYGWTEASDIYIGSAIGVGVLFLIAFINE